MSLAAAGSPPEEAAASSPPSATNPRDELERALRARFDWVIRSYTIGSMRLEFAALRNPDALMDEVTIELSHDEMAWQPYWGKVWPSSLGMGQTLAVENLTGKAIVDLGCGLGVPGCVAAAVGGRVWFVDNAIPALDFVRWNSWPWRDRVEVLNFDWRRDAQLPLQFDMILGSDILYAREDVPYLDRFFRRHLAPGGQILLSEPCRLMTLDILPQVRALGWSVTSSSQLVEQSGEKVNLLSLMRL